MLRNLINKLTGYDEHAGPAQVFQKIMDTAAIPDPNKAMQALNGLRGQGQDDAIDIMQDTLQREIEGRLTDADLLAAFADAVRRSEGK